MACAFSPDGTYVVTGSNNGDLRIWDAKYGHGKYLIQELDGHDLGVTCAEFSPTYGSASKCTVKAGHGCRNTCPSRNLDLIVHVCVSIMIQSNTEYEVVIVCNIQYNS